MTRALCDKDDTELVVQINHRGTVMGFGNDSLSLAYTVEEDQFLHVETYSCMLN